MNLRIEGVTRRGFESKQLEQFHNERFPVECGTHVVDFRVTPEINDPYTTDACVRVLTSDGVIGTLSHLTVFHNPEAFVSDLVMLLGKSGVPAILNGGQGHWLPSKALRDRLCDALVNVGFILSSEPAHEDTLGSFSRSAILRVDRVLVTRKPYGESPPEELTLYFPKVESEEVR